MCWFSIVGGITTKAISYMSGGSEEERKSLEAGLNIAVGSVGCIFDPLGGGILLARGAIQAAGANNLGTDAASAGVDIASTALSKSHDVAIEGAYHFASGLSDYFV